MKNIYIVIALAILFISCERQGDYEWEETGVTITDDGSGTGTVTWSADKEYFIDGFVYVNEGDVLTIEPGTVIRALTGQGENASALIVAKGGQIIAEGTADSPIVFTSEYDPLDGTLDHNSRGLWGGLILLGNAPINSESGEAIVEGVPVSEPRAIYGGDYSEDNSGSLKYVSIRHGGTNIGEGNEINGLTLGGVGSETSIEFVEVYANEDDGVEIMGGTVDISHILVSYCGDDCFDFDLGWVGKAQFLVGVQYSGLGDKGIEITGNTENSNRTPFTTPKLQNVTIWGQGQTMGDEAVSFAYSATGYVRNSVFVNKQSGISAEYVDGVYDCYSNWERGSLDISNNIFYNIDDNNMDGIYFLSGYPSTAASQLWRLSFDQQSNKVTDPGFTMSDGHYGLMPNDNVWDDLANYDDGWFTKTNFKGAYGEDNWTEGWSWMSSLGLLN